MPPAASPALGNGREYVLRPDDQPSDAAGHVRFFVDLKDEDGFLEALRKRRGEPGSTHIEIAPPHEADTQGHAAGFAMSVIVRPSGDGNDTEGHAVSLHFPTSAEADAFRRRLLATGLIVGTVTVGALGATALPGFLPGPGSQGLAGQRAAGPDADIGMMDTANAAAAEALAAQLAAARRANADVGLVDSASEAAAQAMAAQDAVEADSDIGLMDASGRPATADGAPATYVPPERPGPTPR